MCGIGLTLLCDECCCCHQARENRQQYSCLTQSNADELHQSISDELANRGPDLTHQRYTVSSPFCFGDDSRSNESKGRGDIRHEFRVNKHDDTATDTSCVCECTWHLTLLASVLHMRGDEITTQPFVLDDENDIFVLCWNGELYSCNFVSNDVDVDLADYDAADETEHFRSDTGDMMSILSSTIRKARSQGLGSDETHGAVADAVSSVRGEFSFILYHRSKIGMSDEGVYYCRDPFGRRSLLISDDNHGEYPLSSLSRLLVASTSFHVGDRDLSFKELEAGRLFNIDLRTGSATSIPLPRPTLIPPPVVKHDEAYAMTLKENGILESLVRASETFHALLDRAVSRRVVNAPKPVQSTYSDRPASVGVLFSGGIDSVVLAALSDAHVPQDEPIDLINVAFTSPKISVSLSPDRAAALLSFEEMKAKWPSRHWRFIAVDVPYDDVLKNEKQICSLIAPLESTMDFNIATAFWFASRGSGVEIVDGSMQASGLEKSSTSLLRFASNAAISGSTAECSEPDRASEVGHAATRASALSPCTSYARVLLIGIGADEQLGGYGRHRSVYNKGGYEALRAELEMERERLWTRNLGRDDRVIASNGKDARFPFLDEDVVGFLQSLDVLDICDMERPRGEGEKLILRLIAKRIGVEKCSNLVKRAIQFGSRIAKCSDVDRFGSSRKAQGHSRHRQSNTKQGTEAK